MVPLYCNKKYYRMNNARFATALHILTLLHFENRMLTSDYIAGSMNMNPAMVRKEISNLRDLGLVQSKEGKGGGTWLAKPAGQISLSEIYDAVKPSPALGKQNTPNPSCPVGRNINGHLDELFVEVEYYFTGKLKNITVADFVAKFS